VRPRWRCRWQRSVSVFKCRQDARCPCFGDRGHRHCEYGASGDVQFGAVVEKKCEADFLARLGARQKLAYQREMRVCDRKYRNQSGTMYISFTAFCRAEVARRYSQKALKR